VRGYRNNMEKEIVKRAIEYVKNLFADDFSGHDFHHTMRVYKQTLIISDTVECNKDRCALIALLHDVDDHKLSPKTCKNLDNARAFLNTEGVDSEKIDVICSNISKLSFSKNIDPSLMDVEGQIVQDADRLDAIGAIGIARTFAYGGNHNRPIYNPDSNERDSSIGHFYDKLLKLGDNMNTQKGKELAIQRNEFMKDYLKQFYSEWN